MGPDVRFVDVDLDSTDKVDISGHCSHDPTRKYLAIND
jgi:hypothetical protein